MKFLGQKGAVHTLPLLMIVAAVGLISFLLISSTAPFKGGLFQTLFPRSESHAATPGIVFLDNNNNLITQTISPNVKIELNSPWSVADAGLQLIKPAMAQAGSQSQLTAQVNSSSDDVNQDGSSLSTNSGTVWTGTGASTDSSYLGLRFNNLSIPKGAKIISAKLQVYSPQSSWITNNFSIAADATGNSSTFSNSSTPSQRSLTGAKVSHADNVQWQANTWYTLDESASVIQEIVNRSDWQSGNSLSIILKGTGGAYARKNVTSFDGNGGNAPKLVITYSGSGGTTPTSVPTPTNRPSTPASPTPPPTSGPKVASAVVAEDANFTKNVATVASFKTNPTVINYTLSTGLGSKVVFVKYTSTTGLTQVFQGSINVVAATPTPAASATVAPSTGAPGADGALGNSAAYGIWTATKWDTCTKAEHDQFYVIGPDGLRYPTWHAPVLKRANGTTCTFGHEHGQDPSKANIWAQVKDHYAWVKPDGTKDLAHAGIPFGYVNQTMDVWLAATGNTAMAMRHEDHVGHKVAIANNFQIGLDRGNGTGQFFYPGVTCNYIVKVHQGTHSKDAFENNLHEILYNVACSDGHAVSLDTMGKFGAAGQFTRSCDSAGDRTTIIKTGFDYSNAGYPSDTQNGSRGISDRKCVETGFLVPQGQFSQNPYEFWPAAMFLNKKGGGTVVDGLNLLFDVEDSIRYYNPGHIDPTTGLVDNVGHFQDLCSENLNGRTFRGNLCDGSKTASWDDPKAGFKDLNRGTYFKPGITHNAGGPNVWYSDPFGNNAQNTPFAGSLKQYVSSDSISYSAKSGAGTFETANVINMVHDSGGGTVHAPN